MIERYETLEDRIGRVTSFAQLLFAAHRDDPKIGQFYQGVQERVTGIGTRLLFVTLELNKLDDESSRISAGRRRRGWPGFDLGSNRFAASARTSSQTR